MDSLHVEDTKRSRWSLIVGGLGSVFLFYAVAFAAPMAVMGAVSVGKMPLGTRMPEATWDAYIRFWTSSYHRGILLDSLSLALATTIVCLLLAIPLAYMVVHGSRTFRVLALVAILNPLFVTVIVRSFGLELLLRPIGLAERPITVIIGLAQVLVVFMALPIAASFRMLDPLTVHAARTLGAHRVRIALRIVFPVLVPGIWAGSILVFVLALNNFAIPAILGKPDSPVIAMVIYQSAIALGNFPFAAAVAFSLLGVTLVLLSLAGRFGLRGSAREVL